MKIINKIKKLLGIKTTESIIQTNDTPFNNLRLESNGHATKVFIDDVEQHYITKIILHQIAGENLKFHIEKDIRD